MKILKLQMTLAALAAFALAPIQAQSFTEKTRADISITYSALHMNAPVGGCGCFWLNGGSAEAAVPLWRHISAVGELSGDHAGSVPASNGTGISIISYMGGLRMDRDTHRLYHPFVQGLLGGVHAFNSYFPTALAETSANSFAMAVGGGLDISVRKHLLLRPVQLEYQYMQLPNNVSDQQHDLRISVGVVYRFFR